MVIFNDTREAGEEEGESDYGNRKKKGNSIDRRFDIARVIHRYPCIESLDQIAQKKTTKFFNSLIELNKFLPGRKFSLFIET